MSDVDFDDDDPEERTVTLKRDQIRALEKQAKQATDAVARAEAAERKLAFAEAGLPMGDPKIPYFVKAYDGDMTAEAIRQAATDAGYLAAEVSSNDQVQLEQMNRTAAGSSTQMVGDNADYQAAMDAARSAEEVVAVSARFGRLVQPQ